MRFIVAASLPLLLSWQCVLPQVIDLTVMATLTISDWPSDDNRDLFNCLTPMKECDGKISFNGDKIRITLLKHKSCDRVNRLIDMNRFIRTTHDDAKFSIDLNCKSNESNSYYALTTPTFTKDRGMKKLNTCLKNTHVQCALRSLCAVERWQTYLLVRGPCAIGSSAMRLIREHEIEQAVLDRGEEEEVEEAKQDEDITRNNPMISYAPHEGVCLSLLGMALIAGPISVLIVGLGVGIGIVISRRPSEDISVMPPPTCIEASPAAVPNASTTQTTEFPHNTDVEHESPSRDNTTSTVATSMTKREEEPSAPFQQPVPRIPNEEHNVSLTKIFTTTNLPVVSEAKPHTKYDN